MCHVPQASISRHHELFAGYDQQDSQELLVFLMDSLHEDLNRVRQILLNLQIYVKITIIDYLLRLCNNLTFFFKMAPLLATCTCLNASLLDKLCFTIFNLFTCTDLV